MGYLLEFLLVACKITLVVALPFCPKTDILVFCQSVNAVSVVSTLIGGGDTQTLTTKIKFV